MKWQKWGEEEEGRQTFSNLGGGTTRQVKSGLLQVAIECAETLLSPWRMKKKTHYTQKQQYLDFKFPAMHQPRPGFDAINWNKAGS